MLLIASPCITESDSTLQVLHGTIDRMIPVPAGRKLIEWLNPGVGIIKEGVGHVFMLEQQALHDGLIEEQIEKTRALKV